MKKYYALILGIIFSASLSFADSDIHKKIKSASSEYLKDHFFNGTYMFADKDGVIIKGAEGVYSILSKKNLEIDQQMPIASGTKSMTATAILKLQDKGLLNVQDKLAKHLNEKSEIWTDNKIPAWAHKVTIHHLLTHGSGIAEYFMRAEIDTKLSLRDINKQIANFAASQKLEFKPGTKYSYNNTNYILLGLVIEALSGQDAASFFQKELFVPLDMKNTRLPSLEEVLRHQKDPESEKIPSRYFVTPTGGKPQFNLAKHSFTMIPFTDGGVISTTSDLIKWHKALHSHKILSKNSYKQMIKGYYTTRSGISEKTQVGYGLYMSKLENGDLVYHHAGSALAIRSESGCVLSKDLCYAVISNVMNYIPKEMKDKIDMTKKENQLDIIYFTKHILKSL